MRKSRRLFWEFLENREMLSGLPTDFVVYGKWANPSVTYSFAPDGTPWNGTVDDANAVFSAKVPNWQGEIARALSTWASAANLHFSQVGDSGAPQGIVGADQHDPRFGDIRIGGYDMGTTSILGTAFYPCPGTTASGDVQLNTDPGINWGAGLDLYSVALHELGHSLGLQHASDPGEVMYPSYQGVRSELGEGDVAGIQSLYGAAPTSALTLSLPPTQFVQEGSAATFTAVTLGGNGGVTFSLDPGAPAGATINPTTGVFRWTPPNAQATYNVPIRATDATGATDAQNVTVSVFDVPPTVQAGVNGDATAGVTFARFGHFTDPNPDTWVATVDYGDGSGVHPLAINPDKTFVLNHTYKTTGTFIVAVTINDSQGGQGRGFFAVTTHQAGTPTPSPTPTPGTPIPPVVQLTPAQARAQARANARAARQARIAAARAARFARFHHLFARH